MSGFLLSSHTKHRIWSESRCIVDPSNCLPELFLSSCRQIWIVWILGPSVPQPSKPNNTRSYNECIKCNSICSIPFLLTVAMGSHNFEFPVFFCLFDFFIMLIPFLWHRENGRNIYLIFLFQELRLARSLKIGFFLLKDSVNWNIFSWVLGVRKLHSDHSVFK